MNIRKSITLTAACLLATAYAEAPKVEINGRFFNDYIKNADAKKKDSTVEVDEVIKLVDATLHMQMKEIIKLATESKELQDNANRFLLEKKEAMAKIYTELGPLEDRVRTLYPDMVIWFDKLKQFIEEKRDNGRKT